VQYIGAVDDIKRLTHVMIGDQHADALGSLAYQVEADRRTIA
jgi:hypothetical protein